MSIILITNVFDVYDQDGFPTGQTEVLVDYAFDEVTEEPVIVQSLRPIDLGATFDHEIGHWVLEDSYD